MKKAFLGILGAIIAVSVGTTSAFAAGSGARRNFIDTDGDGVCDNYGDRPSKGSKNFVDEDGDGICDNFASGQGKGNGYRNGAQGECGKNFVDEDGDGICDNITSREGRGNGHGLRQGRCGK